MSCCCPEASSASRLFSYFARSYRKRYAKKGFEKSQKQLVEGLKKAGIEGKTLLEIGSGVGYLHQTLLQLGAVSATGVDLSPKMIAEAIASANEKGLSDRTDYIQNDFVNIAEKLDAADVTILDKVVCCYPDADALVHKSLEHTNSVYALTYPRDRWFVRLASKLMAGIFWLLRMDFRNHVHNPLQLEQWIREAGFRKEYENRTIGWQTQVFVRS